MGASGAFAAVFRPSGAVWGRLGLPWGRLGPFWAVVSRLGPSGAVWGRLGPLKLKTKPQYYTRNGQLTL